MLLPSLRHSIIKRISLFSTLVATLMLASCDSEGLPSGGGAGDSNNNAAAAIALITPFAGFFDLQDGWAGRLNDQAFLVIGRPADDGIAVATLHDFDDIDQCIPPRPATGEVRRDDFADRVFMDDILQFDQSELSLSGSILIIEFQDINDIDNDNNTTELLQVQAERLGISNVIDLGEPC